jgi:hypothetical protein
MPVTPVSHRDQRSRTLRLANQLYHLHDGCDRGFGLFNHNAVTALLCKELLAVRG